MIKSSIIIPFQVFGTKIKQQTNTSLFELRSRLSGISHSAAIFNKILYSSIPLILSGISCAIWEAGGQLCSRWWLTSPLISDPGQCFPPWTTCRKMQGVPLQGIWAEQHLSWGCYKTQSKINCIPFHLLMISELGKKSFGYSWYPGPSGILTLNTHSDADWNAFPHTHSWHVFFSILSSWVWEPGDSCACSSFISQQDSKMDHWQETRSTMKTSIAGFCCLVNENNEMQQHKPRKWKQPHKSKLMLGCFFRISMFSCCKVAANGASSTDSSATLRSINGEFLRNTESSAQSCATLYVKTSSSMC